MRKLRAIDLFAGIGGVRLGLKKAGFDVVYSNDCDKYCKITFENYFKDELDNRKIEDVPMEDIPDEIDLLAGGFPCQPFSLAGLRKGFSDPRGNLFDRVAKIIEAKQPRAILLENVKNLKTHDGGKTLDYILDVLRNKLNYYVPEPVVLNSKNFGVPQNRQRIYIVGFKDKVKFKYPKGKSKIPQLKEILEEGIEEENYFISQKYLDGLIKHKNRHEEKGHGFGHNILNKEGIANTLVVGNMGRERNLVEDLTSKYAYTLNSVGVRRLTVIECARLQGFPKRFKFPVSKSQAYKQLGNTVTVPVLKALAKKIFKSLQSQDKQEARLNFMRKEIVTFKVQSV